MPKYPIVERDHAWNHSTQQGTFRFKIQTKQGLQTRTLSTHSLPEFEFITALLKEPRDFWNENDRQQNIVIITEPND